MLARFLNIMNNFVKVLESFGFELVKPFVDFPLVVHAVPGSGKSTLIRAVIRESDLFVAFTAGEPDEQNLSGKHIKKFSANCLVPGKLNILDEYLTVEDFSGFQILFSDPYQNNREAPEANFVKKETRRFGKKTCEYLSSYNFEVFSEKEDEIVKGSPFEVKVEGELICFGKEAIKLAESHNAHFKHPCEVRGKTFEVVTVLKSEEPSEANRHLFYIGMTRHLKKLIILE